MDEFSAWLAPEDPAGPGNRTFFESATVVVDTNVLLDLYRVSSATRNEILYVLKRIRDRLWIPYQVALEYSRNRREAVIDRNKQFSTIKNVLRNSENSSIDNLQTALDKFLKFRERNRSSRVWDPAEYGVDKAGINERIRGIWSAALAELKDLETEIDLSVEDLAADPILSQLDELLSGRVGPAPTTKSLQMHVECALNFRFPNEIPPGFEDVDEKDTPVRQAGDYLLWRQLIDHLNSQATRQSRRVLLVTGDSKSDWWELDKSGNPVRVRPELVHELRQEADSELLLLSLTQFLQGAKEFLNYEVSDAAISEIKEHEEEGQLEELLPQVLQRRDGPINLFDLSGAAFERVVLYLLVSMGWKILGKSPEMSTMRFDFLAIDNDGLRVAVEAKMYRRDRGRHRMQYELRQLHAYMRDLEDDEPADRGLIVTTSTADFRSIGAYARALNIDIIDGPRLCELLNQYGIEAYIPEV